MTRRCSITRLMKVHEVDGSPAKSSSKRGLRTRSTLIEIASIVFIPNFVLFRSEYIQCFRRTSFQRSTKRLKYVLRNAGKKCLRKGTRYFVGRCEKKRSRPLKLPGK